jgi:hypothetical protein
VTPEPAASSRAGEAPGVIATPKLGKATLSECKKGAEIEGGWALSKDELLRAAAIVSPMCASTPDLVQMLGTCAERSGTGRVEVEANAEGRTACSIRPHALVSGGRRWVLFEAFVGVGSAFHSECHIVELEAQKARAYYVGYTDNAAVCSREPASGQPKDAPQPMIDEWPRLATEVRQAMCRCGAKK